MLTRFICKDDAPVKGPALLVVGQTYKIGRSSKCAYVLTNRSVSRVHAEVEVVTDKLIVTDLNSRNGTFVEGERITKADLHAGQTVYFGAVKFFLVNGDVPSELEEDTPSHASTYIVAGKKAPLSKRMAELTQTERAILDALMKGWSERKIASERCSSMHTVHNHIKAIYLKLQVHSRGELFALFVDNPFSRNADDVRALTHADAVND